MTDPILGTGEGRLPARPRPHWHRKGGGEPVELRRDGVGDLDCGTVGEDPVADSAPNVPVGLADFEQLDTRPQGRLTSRSLTLEAVGTELEGRRVW